MNGRREGTPPRSDQARAALQLAEREFLKLAGCFLACRYQIMTDQMPSGKHGYSRGTPWKTLEYSMLGEYDNLMEMRLLCREVLGVTS